MKIKHYLLHSRYRPANILETLFVMFLNLFYTKKTKSVSFHPFRLKKKPSSTTYYNNFGRCFLHLFNFLTIIIFNKLLFKNIFLQNEYSKKVFESGNDDFHWPFLNKKKQFIIDVSNLKKEIEEKCNLEIQNSFNQKDTEKFWQNDKEKFKKYFLNEDKTINLTKLAEFRKDNKDFNALIFKPESLKDLKNIKDKILALNLINLYHKISEKSDESVLLNSTDNNIGKPNYLVYRNQIIHERFLRQIYFHSQIKKFTNLKLSDENIFLEIGPGYGLLPKSLKNIFKNSKFLLVDLPEVNICSYYYLQNCFPNAKICLSHELNQVDKIDEKTIKNYDFLILNQKDVKKIEKNIVNCSINIASFGEMSNEMQNFYIKNIERVTKNYFYSVNRFRKDNILFKHLNGYYEFPFTNDWNKIIYDFSPTLHLETLLEKN